MTEVIDVLVAAGARIDSLEMAAAAGDVSAWPLGRLTVQSRIRGVVFAADHQRLNVIDSTTLALALARRLTASLYFKIISVAAFGLSLAGPL